MTSTLLTSLPEWRALQKHYQQVQSQKMRDWFAEDAQRFSRFSLRFGDFLFDYSKNRITAETMGLLFRLATALDLPAKIQALFSAAPMNSTEARPALHMALRNQANTPLLLKQQDIMPVVRAALDKMAQFVRAVHEGRWLGATGKSIRDVVNIGMGGSHLGPLMSTHALAHQASAALRFHFIADVDNLALQSVWKQLDPERTLFIVSSKSFTTVETLANAKSCHAWLQQRLGLEDVQAHFVAVTAQEEKARYFGIAEHHIFPIWDWVGGRYSIWSAIGLPLALQIGMEGFKAFLEGAYQADCHFYNTALDQNIPVIMALLSVWYVNFFQTSTQAIIPYAYSLKYLCAYLQQLDMESNGKRITQEGSETAYATGPIVWGELGIHGQHAFHQLLHQGTHLVPIDFILQGLPAGESSDQTLSHQDLLVANALSQARALMYGKSADEFSEEISTPETTAQAKRLAKHKEIPGNKPSTLIFMKEMTPKNLGSLLAFYEHKIFVQSVIWDVNPFDQWGVELGKTIFPGILQDLDQGTINDAHDSSTMNLILHYKNLRQIS